ncbi:MAG: TetR-like C-terminal domain-containing protein, partial [Lachnospiraceae bacterium]
VESLIEEFEANKQQGLYDDMFHTMYFLCRLLEKDMKNWSGLLKYQGFYQDFLFKSQKLLKPVTINLLKNEFPNAEGDMIDLAVDYIMSGAVGVLARWLLNPDHYTSMEIAQILTRFMSGNCETLRNSCENEHKPKQR